MTQYHCHPPSGPLTVIGVVTFQVSDRKRERKKTERGTELNFVGINCTVSEKGPDTSRVMAAHCESRLSIQCEAREKGTKVKKGKKSENEK